LSRKRAISPNISNPFQGVGAALEAARCHWNRNRSIVKLAQQPFKGAPGLSIADGICVLQWSSMSNRPFSRYG
jgi:hypothetical protein